MTKMRDLITLLESTHTPQFGDPDYVNPEEINVGTFRVRIYNPQLDDPLGRPYALNNPWINEIIEGSHQKAQHRLEDLWNEYCAMQPGRGWRGILHQKGSKGYLHLITG